MHDELGSRMKEQYEQRTRYFLPRRTYTIIRIDGKAFHTFTKGFDRPFDDDLIAMMDYTAEQLCANIIGCKFAYVQSDEISLVLTDFDQVNTQAYFNGNLQKIASISASTATAAFNEKLRKIAVADTNSKFYNKDGFYSTALFDSRVFTIPDKEEVFNYFIWRQQDAIRNSIQMTASSVYSHKELHKKNTVEMKKMCLEKSVVWDDMGDEYKRGRIVTKRYYKQNEATRSKWEAVGAFDFIERRDILDRWVQGLYYGKPGVAEVEGGMW